MAHRESENDDSTDDEHEQYFEMERELRGENRQP